MAENGSKKITIAIVFIALAIIAFLLVRSYIAVIITAAVLAYVLQWPYKKLNKLIKNENASAAIVVIVVILLLGVGFFLIAQATLKESFNLYLSIQKLDTYQIIEKFVGKFIGSADLTSQVTTAIQRGVTSITNQFVTSVGDLVGNIPKILFEMLILIFVSFYFLKDGKKVMEHIRKILPFDPKHNDRFITRSGELAAATIWGMVIVGIIQGIVMGVGLYVFHAPSPLFFTVLAIFFGILPFVGPWLVWAPVGLAMIAGGFILNGVLLMVFGLVVVGTVTNIVQPLVVGKRGNINPAVALIGMLGGLTLLGPIGLVVGPIILEYLFILIDIYKDKKE